MRLQSVYADIGKLRRHLELGRCQVAAVVVFDDEDYFATSPGPEEEEHLGTPRSDVQQIDADAGGSVWRLIIGPSALRDRGLLAELAPR